MRILFLNMLIPFEKEFKCQFKLWRCDIIADQYFKDSLKQNIRSSRGQGSRKHFKDETKIPEDFRNNFLTNNDNENDHVYLYTCIPS